MPPREIPGFYYDEAKQKYFKIEPNHRAPPTGSSSSASQYTVDSVKRRKLDDEALKAAAERLRLNQRNIKRAGILSNNLLGGVLFRESGHYDTRLQRERLVTDALVKRWEPSEVLMCQATEEGGSGPDETGRLYAPVTNPATLSMRAFEWDPYTHGLFFGHTNGRFLAIDEGDCDHGESWWEYHRSRKFPRDPLYSSHPYYDRRWQCMLSSNDSVMTSINIEPTSRMLLGTWMAPSGGHNFYLQKFSGMGDMIGYQDAIIHFRIDSPLFPRQPTTLWTSTSAPPSSRHAFAIGSSHGIFSISKEIHEMPNWLRMDTPTTPTRDVFSLAYLDHDTNILCAAMRSGRIDVLDLRMDLTDYTSGHDGIQHVTSACHLKQLDGPRLIVAGLENTIAEYDLRFCKTKGSALEIGRRFYDGAVFSRRKKGRHDSVSDAGFTAPLNVYTGHVNEADRELGFDVDREAGLFAAGQGDEDGTVKIWSWRTGKEVGCVDATRVGKSVDRGSVKVLRWVQDRDERASRSLWVAKGTKIVRYGC